MGPGGYPDVRAGGVSGVIFLAVVSVPMIVDDLVRVGLSSEVT